MTHEQWKQSIIIASLFVTVVTITGMSCFDPMFGLYATMGIILGGGGAWIQDKIKND